MGVSAMVAVIWLYNICVTKELKTSNLEMRSQLCPGFLLEASVA